MPHGERAETVPNIAAEIKVLRKKIRANTTKEG